MTISAGTLEVHLEHASGLHISTFRIGSPYVVISCGQSQQITSRTAEGQGSRPVFNETYTFRVDETTPELLIWMYNKRTFQKPDELGWIRIPFANLFQGGGITKLPSTSFPLTSHSSGQHEGLLTLTLTHTSHSFQVPPQTGSAHSYGAQHGYQHSNLGHAPAMAAATARRAYTPSFRSNQGRRPESELQEIAAHAVDIPVLDWFKLYAKLEFADVLRLEDLISAEDNQKVEDEAKKIPPAVLQALLFELATNHPGDLERLQAVMQFNEAKKRPARAPKSVHPFVPNFRSDQGRRSDAEMIEIAANRFNIRPVDWVRLLAKLDFEDARRLEDELISPEDVAEMEARLRVAPSQEMEQVMKELSPADMERMRALYAFNEAKKQAQAQTALLAHRSQIEALQAATRNADAATRRAAESLDRMNNIDSDYRIEYRYSKHSGSSAFDW